MGIIYGQVWGDEARDGKNQYVRKYSQDNKGMQVFCSHGTAYIFYIQMTDLYEKNYRGDLMSMLLSNK